MNQVLGQLPPSFWDVPYAGARFPGSPAVARRPGLAVGANCQLFAYEVLRLFGLRLPPLRSSELWADRRATARVTAARPLDLLLFNATADAYGAHVGVWVGEGRVLHLCAEVGRPAVWELAEFAARPRYRVLLGVRRALASHSVTWYTAGNRGRVSNMPENPDNSVSSESPEITAPVTELASQYIAQVNADLDHNSKEQERVGAEIAALQERLAVLQHDHSVLSTMRQALGATAVPAGTDAVPDSTVVPDTTVVPSPRRKSAAEPDAGRPKRTRKNAAAPGRRTAARKAAGKPATTGQDAGGDKDGKAPGRPTLVDLVRRHLSEQSEPRSTAEVTGALGEAHPGRSLSTTVVRTTLEGLVARNEAQRNKQGSSVYYTATEAPQGAS